MARSGGSSRAAAEAKPRPLGRGAIRILDTRSAAPARAAQAAAGGEAGLAAADDHHRDLVDHFADRPKTSATRATPTTPPTTCMPMKPGTEAGAIPAKVSEKARPMVTAGLAKEVEEVNQ